MILALLGFALAQESPKAAFTDITEQALPDVQVVCGGVEKDWIIEVNGGGLALEDLNQDGALDLVVVDGSVVERWRKKQTGRPPRVFLGKGDGSFVPAPKEWAMDPVAWGTGIALGDVDGDGWCDLCVASMDGLHLYRNQNGRGLSKVAESGLVGGGWFTSAAFFDSNQDGFLDLFAVRYLSFDLSKVPARGSKGPGGANWKGKPVLFGPEGLPPEGDRLYMGRGDGTFADATESSGLTRATPALGLGLVCQDLNGDGLVDLYVANDSMPNHLWQNQGDGTFVESGFVSGVSHGPDGREQAGMGIAIGDLSGGGRPSLFVTNFSGESNVLYVPSSRGSRFRERAAKFGLAMPSRPLLGWGCGFMDWNLDGRLDLWVLNGHVYPEADSVGTDTSYAQRDQLFVQNAAGRFVEQSIHIGPSHPSRAGVAGDIDGDGDSDLIVWNMQGAVQVLRNDASPQGAWVGIQLKVANGNTDALGAVIRVEAGGRTQFAEVQRSAGFQAAQPAQIAFGLGSQDEPAKVQVRWPGSQEFDAARELQSGNWHRIKKDEQ